MFQIDLSGKAMIITGSAGGIGRRMAERALAGGVSVVGFDLRASGVEHANYLEIVGDVTVESTVANAVGAAIERFGRLDSLVNSAGIAGSGKIEQTTLGDWSRVLETNLTGAFLFAKHSIRHLRSTRGAIVNLSSTNGITGGSSLSGAAYACSKAGIIALTKHLANELAADGVRANAIAPGPVETDMIARFGPDGIEKLRQSIPMMELATADDVCDLALFLLSNAARHITGVTIPLSGGLVM